MPIAGEYVHDIRDGLFRFHDEQHEQRPLPAGDFVDLVAREVIGGPIEISVWSLGFHDPATTMVVGSHFDPEALTGPGSARTDWHCVAATVELFAPDSETAAATWTTKAGNYAKPNNRYEHNAGPIDPHLRVASGWRLRVTNTSADSISVTLHMRTIRDTHPIGTTRVPLRVLNLAFDVVLEALMPQATLSGETAHFTFGEELGRTLGLDDGPFGDHTMDIDIPAVGVQGFIQTLDIKVTTGFELHRAAERLGLDDESRADWREKVADDAVVLHMWVLVPEVKVQESFSQLELASLDHLTVHAFVALTNDGGICANGHVLVRAPIGISDSGGLLAIPLVSALLDPPSRIEDALRPPLQEHLPLIYRYFAEVLARLAAFEGGFPAIFVGADADGDAVTVRWTHDPADQRATLPGSAPSSESDDGHHEHADGSSEGEQPAGTVRLPRRPRGLGLGADVGEAAVRDREPGEGGFDPGPLGEMPPEFALGDPTSVAALDQVETIVIVMMENRSFDHVLGYLEQKHGDRYDGITGTEVNEYDADGIRKQVRMVKASDVVREPVTQILDEPHHSTANVARQMADGAMTGFAEDLAPDGNPQFAMTYYTDAELPFHYHLAEQYLVCDRWFSTYAGGTYPNRWAMLGGTTPEPENYDVDDPQIGFVRHRNILDLLTNIGVTWKVFESNASIFRMYANYRLDDVGVVPYGDPNDPDGFERTAKEGRLPQVVFVEPRFTGIPPLRRASDDHPPADMAVGQEFLEDVYTALRGSPQWDKMLLLITYDEHGGFYDHVAPPGTKHGPPEYVGKVPKLHPDGPACMGPRVPTYVVSPFVNPGSVSHTVFDHTSILKSILVRHRQRIQRYLFTSFGERVLMIDHLGAALDRDTPRYDNPDLPTRVTTRMATASGSSERQPPRPPTAIGPNGDRRDFHVSLARAMLPKPRRP